MRETLGIIWLFQVSDVLIGNSWTGDLVPISQCWISWNVSLMLSDAQRKHRLSQSVLLAGVACVCCSCAWQRVKAAEAARSGVVSAPLNDPSVQISAFPMWFGCPQLVLILSIARKSLLLSLENKQQVGRVLHAHSRSLFHSPGCNWWTQRCRTNIALIITCCLLDPQVARGQGSFGGNQNRVIGVWWTHTAISSCGSLIGSIDVDIGHL